MVLGIIALPDDVVSVKWIQPRPYHWEEVFYSASEDFEGTEKEFLEAGVAYEYQQLANGRRYCPQ